MKKYVTISISTILTIGLIAASYAGSASVQSKTKRTVSEVHFHSELISHPVEFSNLKIRDKSSKFSSMFEEGNKRLEKVRRPDTEFAEDDDFWEYISFDVTNVSDKTIVCIRTGINLYAKDVIQKYSSKQQDQSLGKEDVALMMLEFGNASDLEPPFTESLKPGESTTFTIHPQMANFVRREVVQFSSPIVRVGIFTSFIGFADGSSWSFSGKTTPPKSKDKQSSLKNPKPYASSKITYSNLPNENDGVSAA